MPAGAAEAHPLPRQACGWTASRASIEAALQAHAPVDGVFGLSQGAAAAAALLAERAAEAAAARAARGGGGAEGAAAGCGSGGDAAQWGGLRFAILASGFVSPDPQHRALLRCVGPLPLPSLHLIGGGGGGVTPELSEELAAAFDPACGRQLLRHGGGHDVPRTKALVAAVRAFVAAQPARAY